MDQATEESIRCRLAKLDGASREAVEATIALWPLYVRMYLAVEGIIDTTPDPDAASRGESTDFSLTDTGMAVIRKEAHNYRAGGRPGMSLDTAVSAHAG